MRIVGTRAMLTREPGDFSTRATAAMMSGSTAAAFGDTVELDGQPRLPPPLTIAEPTRAPSRDAYWIVKR